MILLGKLVSFAGCKITQRCMLGAYNVFVVDFFWLLLKYCPSHSFIVGPVLIAVQSALIAFNYRDQPHTESLFTGFKY